MWELLLFLLLRVEHKFMELILSCSILLLLRWCEWNDGNFYQCQCAPVFTGIFFSLVKYSWKKISATEEQLIHILEMEHINWICMKWKLPCRETEIKPTISQVLISSVFFISSAVIGDVFFAFKKPESLFGVSKWKHAYLLMWVVKLRPEWPIYLLCLSGDWI